MPRVGSHGAHARACADEQSDRRRVQSQGPSHEDEAHSRGHGEREVAGELREGGRGERGDLDEDDIRGAGDADQPTAQTRTGDLAGRSNRLEGRVAGEQDGIATALTWAPSWPDT